MFRAMFLGWLMDRAGEGGDGGGGPGGDPPAPPAGGTPPAPPAPPAGGEPPPASPFAVFPTKEAFDAYKARAADSELNKIFGTKDRAAIAESWKQYQEWQKNETERKRAEMAEIDRYKDDLAREQAEKERAQAELDEMRFSAHVGDICAKLGVKNTDYAKFIVVRAADALPDGEQLDVEVYLKEQMNDSQAGAAFGVVLPPTTVERPASTAPEPGSGAPPAPPAPGTGAPAPKSAMEMTAQEFAAHVAQLGVSASIT